MEIFQSFRRNIPDHIPEFSQSIGNRRSGGSIDISPCCFLPDMIEFQSQTECLLRCSVIKSLDSGHFGNKEVAFVTVDFINKDTVNAKFIKVNHIFHGMTVFQTVKAAFQTAFTLFLCLAFPFIQPPSSIAGGFTFFHCSQFFLIFFPDQIGIILNHIETALSNNDNIPFAGGNASEKAFAFIFDQILFGGDKDIGRRIKFGSELCKLL